MSRVSLSYLLVVLIWGSTWFAIKFQLSISPITSVFYRFLLAATVSFLYCQFRGLKLRFSQKQHSWMAAQGVCLFSMNYILFYFAEKNIASGLVSATFTLVIYLNMLGLRVFFKRPISKQVLMGSALGGAGILLLFLDSILDFRADSPGLRGLFLGLTATVFASIGNLISVKLSREQIPVFSANSWGMLYGTTFTFLILISLGQSFEIKTDFAFVSSLLYLALFGSVIAFGSYLTLIAKIGADRAAYINILTPVIALLISSLFEDFEWRWWTVAGMILCGIGNYIALHLASEHKKMVGAR